jgi:hypothetical protein
MSSKVKSFTEQNDVHLKDNNSYLSKKCPLCTSYEYICVGYKAESRACNWGENRLEVQYQSLLMWNYERKKPKDRMIEAGSEPLSFQLKVCLPCEFKDWIYLIYVVSLWDRWDGVRGMTTARAEF